MKLIRRKYISISEVISLSYITLARAAKAKNVFLENYCLKNKQEDQIHFQPSLIFASKTGKAPLHEPVL